MIIIVEGPDGAGKTTTIQELLKSHPGSISRHFGNPKTEEEAFDYYKVYAQAIKEADPTKVTIFDRSWYSDLVYGPVIRNVQEMSYLHAEMLEALVISNGGGFVVYCTAPLSVLWSRCKKRGETYIQNIEQLGKISEAYKKVFSTKCNLPVIRFDTAARW